MVQAVISLSILNYHVIRPLHLDLHEIHEPPVGLTPSANSCFNTIGTIDLREYGGCYPLTGKVALYIDAPPSQQGGCFNRQ